MSIPGLVAIAWNRAGRAADLSLILGYDLVAIWGGYVRGVEVTSDKGSGSMVQSDGLPRVGIVMGSRSDWEPMKHASEILQELGVPHEQRVVSAHRTPERLFRYAKEAEGRGIEVIIAGAGGAAHLPGMIAAISLLPVLGVPVESRVLRGVDSLLSIVQMPKGIPVGTLAIGSAGAANAGLLAAAILARSDTRIRQALESYRARQTEAVGENPE